MLPSHWVWVCLAALLVSAAYTDLRWRRIPNWQTIPALALGIALGAWSGGAPGLLASLEGAGLGLAVSLVPYLLGHMGGGDVKLQMAIGALLGWPLVLSAFVYAAIAGGVLALLFVARQHSIISVSSYFLSMVVRGLWPLLGLSLPDRWQARLAAFRPERPPALRSGIPYAVPMGIGAFAAWSLGQWQPF